MNCPTCSHGPRPCGHPEVSPHEGEPPEPTGAAVVEWLGTSARHDDARGVWQFRRGHRCPGFGEQ